MMKKVRSFFCLAIALVLFTSSFPIADFAIDANAASEQYLWPVEGIYGIGSNYGLRDLYGTGNFDNYHRGIDINSYGSTVGAADGCPVRATKSGTIYHIVNNIADNTFIAGSFGNCVRIDHGDGTYSLYAHMKPVGIKACGSVKQGEVIGYIGNTGESYGAHLHFQLFTNKNDPNGSTLNPMPTNANISLKNTYKLPAGWPSAKTTYVFDVPSIGVNLVKYSYSSHCTIKVTENDKNIMSLPCSNKTNSKSDKVESAPKGTTYEAIGLIKNIEDNLWYKVKAKNGKVGYIFAGNVAFESTIKNDIVASGISVPANHTQGKSYVLTGSVKDPYNIVSEVSVNIYSGSNTSGTSETGGSESINTTSFALGGSSIDKNTKFNILPVGKHTYVVRITYKNYFAKSDKESAIKTATGIIYKQTFNVVSSHSHSYSSHYEADHPHKVYNKCSCGDWHYTGATTSVSSCSKCNPTEPSTIIYPNDGGVYKIAYGGGNNMYLDFAISGNNVQIYENCDGHSDPAFVKSQYFKLTHVGDGWYSIINIGNGKAVDIEGINPTSGTNIQQWEYLGNNGQLYRFYDAGNGYCYIKSKLGTYVDKKDGDTSNDTNVWSYEFNGTVAQKWQLMLIEDIISTDESKSINNKHFTNAEKLSFSGWAFSNRGKSVTFKYVLDSSSPVTIKNCNRPDVKKVYSQSCAYTDVGYGFSIDLSELSVGKHTMKIIATSFFGTSLVVSNLCFYVDEHSHTYLIIGYNAASCTLDGMQTSECEICKDKKTVKINKLGHDYGDWITVKEATCTQTGIEQKTCKRCNNIQTQSIPKTGHNYVSKVTTVANCKVSGIITYTCNKCKHSYTETISKTSHKWTAATCTAKKTCSFCGLTDGSALGHSYSSNITKVATCTETGTKTFSCTRCNHSYTEMISAKGHSNDWLDNKCDTCGTVMVSVPTEILYPENEQVIRIAPTFDNISQGYVNMFLSYDLETNDIHIYENFEENSNEELVKSQYFKLIHIDDGWYVISNVSNGKVFDVKSGSAGTNVSLCEREDTDSQMFRFYDDGNGNWYIKSKLGCYLDAAHGQPSNEAKVMTYAFNGSSSERWKITKHSHSYVVESVTEPTCVSYGENELKCYCGEYLTEIIVDFGDHVYEDWVVVTPSTCIEKGKQVANCKYCTATKTEPLPETDHDYANGFCLVCGNEASLSEIIGDINEDERITAADARIALRASVGLETLSETQRLSADVDNNSKITAADARLILRASVGLEKLDAIKKD